MPLDPIEPTGLDLTTVSLCDYANVREGLLNIVSGGITRVAVHSEFPAHIEAHLAMSVYVHPHRVGQAHNGRVILRYPDTAEEVARVDFEFNVDAERQPGEGLNIPFALPLRTVEFPHDGQVDVSVSLDGSPAGMLTFWLNAAG